MPAAESNPLAVLNRVFGALHRIDVLHGKANERIRRLGHDRQSTFGIGQDLAPEQWRSVFRQLVAAGLVAVDIEGHGGLRLTEAARPLLRGERRIRLRRDPGRRARARSDAVAAVSPPLDPEAMALWERLRAQRRALAEQQGVPPFAIFPDATLREIVTYRPRDADEIKAVEYALSQVPEDSPVTLKPAFDVLDGRYSYGILRCVRAALLAGG